VLHHLMYCMFMAVMFTVQIRISHTVDSLCRISEIVFLSISLGCHLIHRCLLHSPRTM
jgi:hypothetical protein